MDISVTSTSTQVEDRTWLASDFGIDEPRNITLDVSAFVEADHYPNGYVKSGMVLAKLAGGLFVPYSNAGSGGAEVAVGILFSSVKVPANGTTDVGAAMLEMGLIVEAKLPYSGVAGAIDSAGKTDLVNWFKFL
jgi:hypothetical protein